MAQDNKGNKGTNIPSRPHVPTQDGWPRNMPRPIHESNNDVSNTLRPKTGTPPIGKEPGKK